MCCTLLLAEFADKEQLRPWCCRLLRGLDMFLGIPLCKCFYASGYLTALYLNRIALSLRCCFYSWFNYLIYLFRDDVTADTSCLQDCIKSPRITKLPWTVSIFPSVDTLLSLIICRNLSRLVLVNILC